MGTGSSYSVTGMHTGDIIYCVLTSNAVCPTTNTDTSNYLTLTVDAPNTTSVSITPSATGICPGESITFTATPTNGGTPSYLWKKNGINTGFAGNPYTASNFSNNDQITVQMTSSLSCVTQQPVTSSPISVIVYPTPNTAVTVNGSLSLCQGQSVTLGAAIGNSYQWSTGATSANISVSQAGNYRVTVTSPQNCTAVSVPKIVTVTPVLTTSVTVNASSTIVCPGAEITFTAIPVNGGTPNYRWWKNGTTIMAQVVDHFTASNLVNNDQITVDMTSTLSCVSQPTVTSPPVIVTDIPTPVITQTGNTLSSSVATGNQWYLNGTLISGATGQTYTIQQIGNYTVVATINGCTSSASNHINVTNTGIQNMEMESISFYPNPATSQIFIETNDIPVIEINIYTTTGAVVGSVKQPQGRGIDISEFANGVYIAEIKTKEGSVKRRWVKM